MKVLLVLSLLALPLCAAEGAPLALKKAAKTFLESLDEPKLAKAKMPFAHQDRENWRYTPRARLGLPLKDMNESQKNAAVGLVTATLSERGAFQAAQIIKLEGVLAALENNPERRDEEKYYISIFGEPGDPKHWGFRFEGHHLSINITIVGGEKIAVTPSFMGTNPASIREGHLRGLRPLAAEEDLARALAVTLRDAGKKAVLFSDKAPREILNGEERQAKQLEPVGLRASDMGPSQREGLFELIRQYTHRHREDIAEAELKRIQAEALETIRFGWAGSLEEGQPYYYRIQSETFLIEAANTQNDANHMHSVWRNFQGDFGKDLLRQHLEESH